MSCAHGGRQRWRRPPLDAHQQGPGPTPSLPVPQLKGLANPPPQVQGHRQQRQPRRQRVLLVGAAPPVEGGGGRGEGGWHRTAVAWAGMQHPTPAPLRGAPARGSSPVQKKTHTNHQVLHRPPLLVIDLVHAVWTPELVGGPCRRGQGLRRPVTTPPRHAGCIGDPPDPAVGMLSWHCSRSRGLHCVSRALAPRPGRVGTRLHLLARRSRPSDQTRARYHLHHLPQTPTPAG